VEKKVGVEARRTFKESPEKPSQSSPGEGSRFSITVPLQQAGADKKGIPWGNALFLFHFLAVGV
jgi:hypothetical protein